MCTINCHNLVLLGICTHVGEQSFNCSRYTVDVVLGVGGLNYSGGGLHYSGGGLHFSGGGLHYSGGGLHYSDGDTQAEFTEKIELIKKYIDKNISNSVDMKADTKVYVIQ